MPTNLPATRGATILFLWVLLIGLVLSPLAFGLGSAEVASGPGLAAGRLVQLSANSLYMAGLAAGLALAAALPAALVAMRLESGRTRAVLLASAATTLFIPPPVMAVAAIRLFGPGGSLARMITGIEATFPVSEQIGAPALRIPGAPIYTLTGGAFTLAWAFFPLAALAIAARLHRADRDAEDAALLETTPFGVLRSITLPAALGSIAAGSGLVFLFSITEFGVPESLRSLPVLVSEVYAQFGVYYDTGPALAASLVLVGVAGLAIWFTGHRCESPDNSFEPEDENRRRWTGMPMLRGAGWFCAALPAAAAIGILLATATGPHGPLPVWSSTWSTASGELFFSFALGAAAAVLAGTTGCVLAWVLAGTRRPRVWRLALAAPLVIPGPVFGVAVQLLLRRDPDSLPFGLDDALARWSQTLGPLLSVWMFRYAPVVALLAERQLRAIPAAQWEAARIEGARAWGLWRLIAWPAVWPAAAAGMLAVFALTLGEVGAAVLLLPPGRTTLGVRLMTLMHYAPTGQVSALCLLATMPSIAAFGLAAMLWSRFGGDRRPPGGGT
ncbi:iron ABC transporter permease [Candidatus Poribacteria bacterium]|nr:iron ABC transporter permease [Candidatus Poribacteria bacterium]